MITEQTAWRAGGVSRNAAEAAHPRVLLSLAIAVIVLGVAAFSLSFDALRDLAVASGIEQRLAWVWPLVVDGFICVATVAAVLLRPRGWRISWYPWVTLTLAACVSVAGNALHASVHADLSRVSLTVAALVSAVPPAALLCASHMLVVLLAPPSASRSATLADVKDDAQRPQSSGPLQAVGVGDSGHVSGETVDGRDARPVRAEESPGRKAPVSRVVRPTTEELQAWLTQESVAGRRVTGAGVAERFGVSESTGRRWLQLVREVERSADDAEQRDRGRQFTSFGTETTASANGSSSSNAS